MAWQLRVGLSLLVVLAACGAPEEDIIPQIEESDEREDMRHSRAARRQR